AIVVHDERAGLGATPLGGEEQEPGRGLPRRLHVDDGRGQVGPGDERLRLDLFLVAVGLRPGAAPVAAGGRYLAVVTAAGGDEGEQQGRRDPRTGAAAAGRTAPAPGTPRRHRRILAESDAPYLSVEPQHARRASP